MMSYAHVADWLFVLARTDPEAVKHRGISFLLVDKSTPGISVRPLVNMAEEHHFNETFFENVRGPKENVVWELNQGWTVAKALLGEFAANILKVIEQRRAGDNSAPQQAEA